MKKILLFFAVIATLSVSYPQEVGIAPVKLWSNNYELQNPYGFGIYYYQKIWKTGVKLEYITAKNNREYFGYLFSGFFVNPEKIYKENVKSITNYRAIEISVAVPKIFEFKQFSLNLFLGFTFDRFDGERTGLSSGKHISLFYENKTGYILGLSIAKEGLFGLPLKTELLFKQKNLNEHISITDAEQPFGGALDIKELQLNISYIFIR